MNVNAKVKEDCLVTLKQYENIANAPKGKIVGFKFNRAVAVIQWGNQGWFTQEDGTRTYLGDEWSIEELTVVEKNAIDRRGLDEH